MLTTELIQGVRDVTDEANTSDLTDAKILAALNRAQLKLARLSARHYPEMLKRTHETSTFSGREIVIPSLSQSFTVNEVAAVFGGVTYPITYNNTANLTSYEVNSLAAIPREYGVMGNKLLLYPSPQSGILVRIRYQLRAPKLVIPQGRITSFDLENGYLYLDSFATNPANNEPYLTTSISQLKAFINVVNKFTGAIVGTYQIVAMDTASKRLTIKSASLSRTEVFGYTIDAALSSDIALDDYVTLAEGTCIPIYYTDYTDYLIQHAVVEIKRTYNVDTTAEYAQLQSLEEDVRLVWAARPTGIKVQARSPHWNRSNYTLRR